MPPETTNSNSNSNSRIAEIFDQYLYDLSAGNALDIGCGKGKNAVFLSKKGFNVDAIDKNPENIQGLNEYIQKNKIKNLNTQTINALDFNFEPAKYNFIVASFSLIFFKLSDLIVLIDKIKKSATEECFIYFSVFSTKEPAYDTIIKELGHQEVEKNTLFLHKQKAYRHFFTREELGSFFSDWEIIFVNQYNKEDYHEKAGKHFHNIIEILSKNRAIS